MSYQYNLKRIGEIEAQVKHDVIAFLEQLEEQIGDSAKYKAGARDKGWTIDACLRSQKQNHFEKTRGPGARHV